MIRSIMHTCTFIYMQCYTTLLTLSLENLLTSLPHYSHSNPCALSYTARWYAC